MDRWMARQEDGCRQVLAHNEYEIKKANTMHGWMCPHGDRCRYVVDNNEHKIKNDIHRGWAAMETDAGMSMIMNIK